MWFDEKSWQVHFYEIKIIKFFKFLHKYYLETEKFDLKYNIVYLLFVSYDIKKFIIKHYHELNLKIV